MELKLATNDSLESVLIRDGARFENLSVQEVQLNKFESYPYFPQNFQCTTMLISVFCKILELSTELEIAFVLISVDSQGDITQV